MTGSRTCDRESQVQRPNHYTTEHREKDGEDALPEDGNEKVEQQNVGNEQVDSKQHWRRPLHAVDLRVIVVHQLTSVGLVRHTRHVAHLTTCSHRHARW